MSLESVRTFLAANAPDIEIIETAESSSTVALAAEAHGVEPAISPRRSSRARDHRRQRYAKMKATRFRCGYHAPIAHRKSPRL